MTCIWYAIKYAKRKTAEAVHTINDEHTSRSFDENWQFNMKHAKAISDKHYLITKVRRVVKERDLNAQELEKELKPDDRTATKKIAIHKRMYEQSKHKAGNLM